MATTAQHAAPTKNAAVPNPRIEVWRGSYVGHWYWHERGVNGKITVTGGEAFSRKWSAKRAAKRYAKAAGLPVVILDQKNGERP